MALRPTVLDLSHHNTVVSFERLKAAGIQAIIHKATEGGLRGYRDPDYAKRRQQALDAGLLWGAYHFGTNADPIEQAEAFLGCAAPDASTLLSLDWENNPHGPNMTAKQARAFLDRVMAKTGRLPSGIIIYGGNVLREQIISPEDMAYFGRFPLWVCHYQTPAPKIPKAWSKYWLWQYDEHGKVDGMAPDGNVDLNVFGGGNLAAEWAPQAGAYASNSRSDLPVGGLQDTAQHEAAHAADEPEHMVIPAADPPKESQASYWDRFSFYQLNDLADQGSRVAGWIRSIKRWFWGGAATTAGGASALMQSNGGTRNALEALIMDHPFLFVGVVVGITAVVVYGLIKIVERFLLTAAQDGRYRPRGS